MSEYNKGDKFVVEVKLAYTTASTGAAYDMGVVTLNERQLDKLDKLDYEYVNEYFGDLQDYAYEKGKEDAWRTAWKISGCIPESLDENALLKIFGTKRREQIYKRYTINQAMELVKIYEEGEKIKVGDIVMTEDGEAVITAVDSQCYHMLLLQTGRAVEKAKGFDYIKNKTGRTMNICNLLKEAAGVDKEGEA